jgi:hypothetical protein
MRLSRLAPKTTAAPSWGSCLAAASPIPLLAPVMTITFPFILFISISSISFAFY